MTKLRRNLLAVASTALLSLNAHASIVAFGSSTLFDAATTGRVTDTFNDLTANTTPASGLSRTLGGGTFTATSADASALYVGTSSFAPSGGSYLSNNDIGGQPIEIGAFASGLPTTAFSGYFFGSDQVPIPATITVTAFEIGGATLTQTFSCTLTVTSCYVGFTSTTGFSKLQFSSNTNYVGLDDLTFGNAVNETPEPSSLALAALAGLMSAAAVRRRSQA
jgi:MYXO-CTERM domain-containing protein